jgi:uncharacterized membrane protein YfcA
MERRAQVAELLGLPWDARLIAVVLAAVVGGFMRGFVGFGGALVAVPLLTVAFGPRDAVAISSLIGLPATVQLLPQAVRYSEREIILPTSLAILATAPLGSWLLVSLDPHLMSIAISILVVGMIPLIARSQKVRRKVKGPGLVMAGMASGIIQGTAGIGGPPLVAVALSRGGAIEIQRGNVLALVTTISLATVVPLALFGAFSKHVIVVAIVMLPIYLVATSLGSRYFSRGGQRHFRTAALMTLLAIGLFTLIGSVRAYLTG